MTKVSIIGAGNSGLTMAAHLSAAGNTVSLWNHRRQTISELIKTRCIHCHGVIEADARICTVSTDIRDVILDTGLILITTPANTHQKIARILAPHLSEGSCVVLNPGRTCGALEFRETLVREGCRKLPLIAETQTIIYTCRKTDPVSTNLFAFKEDVFISAINPADTEIVRDRLPDCIRPYFVPARSTIQTSIGNVGMIMHCAPVLFNAGWIENLKTSFKYYRDGITPTVAQFLEKLDRERLAVAELLGDRVESVTNWLKRSYRVSGRNLYECIQNNPAYAVIDAPVSLMHRYLLEDVPAGLVPLEALGKRLGLPMKSAGMVIDFASALLNVDFRSEGRNLERLGLAGRSNAEIREMFHGRWFGMSATCGYPGSCSIPR